MKNTHSSASSRPIFRRCCRAGFRPLAYVLLALGVVCLPACGPRGQDASSVSPADPKGGPAAPASAVVVAQPISLRKFAVLEGAEVLGKTSANLSYKIKGDPKSVYEFQRKQFLALGWTELPGTQVSADSASGNFRGAGYTISVTVYPFGGPGLVTVLLNNHGSIDLAKLPVPPGAKPLYSGPLGAMYVTEASVATTTDAVRQLLLAAGWEPHGNEGDSWHYKQGLNRISARTLAAPAQGGKTVIDYSGELLCGDLPVPLDAQDIRYTEPQEEVTFKTTADKAALLQFYNEKLSKTGWKPGEENMLRIDDYDQMGYYAPNRDVLFLKVWPEANGTRNVRLEFLSKEAIDAMDKHLNEQQAAAKLKQTTGASPSTPVPAPEPAPAALPKVTVALPAGATDVEPSAQRLRFKVAKGQGQAVTQGYQKHFKEAGWKEESVTLSAKTGVVAWSKGAETTTTQRVFLNYTDFGTAPAEFKFSSFGAQMEATGGAR